MPLPNTLTVEPKIYGKEFRRRNLRSDAWYVLASRRLAARWAKQMGVGFYKPYVEREARPEYRDNAIYVYMEYVVT